MVPLKKEMDLSYKVLTFYVVSSRLEKKAVHHWKKVTVTSSASKVRDFFLLNLVCFKSRVI